MNIYFRTLSCVALLGTTLATLGQYRPQWAARYGLDWWSLPRLQDEVRRAEQEQAEGVRRGEATVGRIVAKEEVLQEFLAGRLTFLQTASRFRALNAAGGVSPAALRARLGGATDEEGQCRQVISWAVASATVYAPDDREPMRRRLEAELAELLARNNGLIRLEE